MDIKELRKLWLKAANDNKELFENRIYPDIEKNRKGYCRLRFVDKDGNAVAGKKVKITQTSHHFKYGANIFMLDEFGDESLNNKYRELFKKYFNLATVPFYWGDLEPEQNKPRFAKDSKKIYRRPAPDLCIDYCDQSGIDAKLHCLVYDKFIPDWLEKSDMSKMEAAYEKRISEIADRYNGRLYEIEVINEVLCSRHWENCSVISSKRDVIEWAFSLARKYMPYETLVYNETYTFRPLSELDYISPIFMQLDIALKNGTDMDKIGLQAHCFRGAKTTTEEEYEADILTTHPMFDPKELIKSLDLIAEFEKPMEITEITVPTFGDTEEAEELQAELLELFYTVCFSHPNMETLVYWNLPDDYAWAPTNEGKVWDENKCRGGLFHHDMSPKKSAERLYHLFNEKWHTDLELVTDSDGYVEFRGFYGDYTADGEEFALSKDGANSYELEI